MIETDITTTDGRVLHVYDVPQPQTNLVVFWHHGTPNVGEPPAPLLPAAERDGIRWISYDRPGYGGSPPQRGRTVASVAADVTHVADALGVERFAAMGHSGGGPHALACAALMPERILGVVCGAGLAPFGAKGLDWFAGMAPSGEAELRAAMKGPGALQRHLASTEFDPAQFTDADHAALAGTWSWLNAVAGRGTEAGLDGMVADDLAFVASWGFDIEAITAPVLYLYGDSDRIVPGSHGEWLSDHTMAGELWLRAGAGHISLLEAAEDAVGWLAALSP